MVVWAGQSPKWFHWLLIGLPPLLPFTYHVLLKVHFTGSIAETLCFPFCLPAVYCKEWQAGYGSVFLVCHWHEPECDDLQPSWTGPATQQWNSWRGRQWRDRAKEETVQTSGRNQGGKKVLLQLCVQADRCWYNRYLRQGCVSFHFCCGERDLLGGLHHVKEAMHLSKWLPSRAVYKTLLELCSCNAGGLIQLQQTESVKKYKTEECVKFKRPKWLNPADIWLLIDNVMSFKMCKKYLTYLNSNKSAEMFCIKAKENGACYELICVMLTLQPTV